MYMNEVHNCSIVHNLNGFLGFTSPDINRLFHGGIFKLNFIMDGEVIFPYKLRLKTRKIKLMGDLQNALTDSIYFAGNNFRYIHRLCFMFCQSYFYIPILFLIEFTHQNPCFSTYNGHQVYRNI